MPSLKSKQLLIKAAKLSQKEEKISKREIKKKISQIKRLASEKEISKSTLKKEIIDLEKLLKEVLLLEKRLSEKEKEKNDEIDTLKKQIKSLKQKMSAAKDTALRKKVEKLSHLIGDLTAKEAIKREVSFEKKKVESFEKLAPVLTLKKIDEFQEKILALKNSGECPPEKIVQLEKRLTRLEKKLPVRAVLGPETVRHKMLFAPRVKETIPVTRPSEGNVQFEEITKLKEKVGELFLPPPPKKKKAFLF